MGFIPKATQSVFNKSSFFRENTFLIDYFMN